MFHYKQLLEENKEELAVLVSREHGKTIDDAKGSITRGIEIVEFACGIPQMMKGEYSANVGSGVDSFNTRQALGVCAGITPFNFPIMVPMWMWPMAVACGNTFVLKPSEKDPISAVRTTELAHEAGFPEGVLNLVHGGPAVVDRLLAHEDVAAVSFVGSTRAGASIYAKGAAHGKRVQCMCGAKNFSIIMPDANRGAAVDGIFGSAFGNTGQRCLAGSVVVCVGDSADWFVPALVERTRGIKIGAGDRPDTSMGPMQDLESRDRVLEYVGIGEAEGASVLIDGRTADIPSAGCFVGPTILDHVTPDMRVGTEEIFGPVVVAIAWTDVDDVVRMANDTAYGLGAYVWSHDIDLAITTAHRLEAGWVQINHSTTRTMSLT